MAVKLAGLEDNARKTAITELQACMSDGLALSMALKQAHWNMRGPNFIAVHELMDQVKARLDPGVDAMAERIQQLDGTAVGTVEEVAKATERDNFMSAEKALEFGLIDQVVSPAKKIPQPKG